jgi:hypothetical protein
VVFESKIIEIEPSTASIEGKITISRRIQATASGNVIAHLDFDLVKDASPFESPKTAWNYIRLNRFPKVNLEAVRDGDIEALYQSLVGHPAIRESSGNDKPLSQKLIAIESVLQMEEEYFKREDKNASATVSVRSFVINEVRQRRIAERFLYARLEEFSKNHGFTICALKQAART